MKIIFAGTPQFAVPALAALIKAGHEIAMVLTQPDRPAGRGMQLRVSVIKQLAMQYDILVYQPASLQSKDAQTKIKAVQSDVMIVAAYGLIIPEAVLKMPKNGCYNIHGSLLPRWRGAAPIHRAILAGDHKSGVTIMEVVYELDAGAIVRKKTVPILGSDTTQTLHDTISVEGAKLMVEVMDLLQLKRPLDVKAQDEALVTYAHKVKKAEAILDWRKDAVLLSRQIRAFNPFPVATAQFRGSTCRIWFAVALHRSARSKNGEIIALGQYIDVACGEGVLQIHQLQMPGGKRQDAIKFIQGQHVKVGELFE